MPDLSDEQIGVMLANSYRNFHVKGADYLCVHRSPEITRRVYFFEGDVSKLPEVVNPHDHRYDFNTKVLAGAVSNSLYAHDPDGEVYNQFDWRTPLNGGNGFSWNHEARLKEIDRVTYIARQRYALRGPEIHTIRMRADRTVIMVDAFESNLPVGEPTSTFTKYREPPSTDGLYERFTADQLLDRWRQFRALIA